MNESLAAYRDSEFRLQELVELVRRFVSMLSPPTSDGRVSASPDERTLRYYQSLGLLGRPIRYDGRQAVYGYEHLLRAVAIKLLQAQGLSLAQVQSALAATSVGRLEAAIQDVERRRVHEERAAGRHAASRHPGLGFAMPTSATYCADRRAMAPPAHLRHLAAAELRSGVWVIVDPEQVSDLGDLLGRLARAISQFEERT